MPALKKCLHIKPRDFIHAGEAAITVQNMLKKLDMPSLLVRRVAICGYEAEMNVVMHGGEGKFCLLIDSDQIVLEVSDDGEGIEDIPKAMERGYSTASLEYQEMGFGAGMGLPNMEKHSDSLHIESEPGKGTFVSMIFHVPEPGTSEGS